MGRREARTVFSWDEDRLRGDAPLAGVSVAGSGNRADTSRWKSLEWYQMVGPRVPLARTETSRGDAVFLKLDSDGLAVIVRSRHSSFF